MLNQASSFRLFVPLPLPSSQLAASTAKGLLLGGGFSLDLLSRNGALGWPACPVSAIFAPLSVFLRLRAARPVSGGTLGFVLDSVAHLRKNATAYQSVTGNTGVSGRPGPSPSSAPETKKAPFSRGFHGGPGGIRTRDHPIKSQASMACRSLTGTASAGGAPTPVPVSVPVS